MEEWLKEQLARGFADFSGTTVTGSIPVKEDLINQIIAGYLAHAGGPAKASPALDLSRLVRLVRSAAVHAGPGVVTISFEIGV